MNINKHFHSLSAVLFLITIAACGGGDSSENGGDSSENTTVAKPFITIWKTNNPGASNDDQIKIGTLGANYLYQIDWGDGKTDDNIIGDITHTYASPGTYTVAISGNFPQIYFENFSDQNYDNKKILSVEQWGTNQWASMRQAFLECTNLVVNATDSPDLSQVTSMIAMFFGASAFNQDLSNWDVSNVNSMRLMFSGASAFNQNLNSWDVSNVNSMKQMFSGASAFNQDLGNWDVSGVTDMKDMFKDVTLSTANYDALLLSWSVRSLQSDVNFSAGNSTYSSSSQGARDTLTNVYNWAVTDAGVEL